MYDPQIISYLYDVESYSGLQKLDGFKDAHRNCGFAVNPKLIVKVDKDIDEVEKVVTTLLNTDIHFSAVVTSEDQLAIGAMHALQKKGFCIPNDLPVIGFNNSLLCECTMPKLSSVDNMVESLCNTAVTILTDVFDGKAVTNKMTLSAKFVERDTFKL